MRIRIQYPSKQITATGIAIQYHATSRVSPNQLT